MFSLGEIIIAFENLHQEAASIDRLLNTLQHTAKHGNTRQHTATNGNTLQHTATHCNTLQHTTTHCNTRQQPPSEFSKVGRMLILNTDLTKFSYSIVTP